MLFNKINRLVPLLTHHKLLYQSFTFKILKLREKKRSFWFQRPGREKENMGKYFINGKILL